MPYLILCLLGKERLDKGVDRIKEPVGTDNVEHRESLRIVVLEHADKLHGELKDQ